MQVFVSPKSLLRAIARTHNNAPPPSSSASSSSSSFCVEETGAHALLLLLASQDDFELQCRDPDSQQQQQQHGQQPSASSAGSLHCRSPDRPRGPRGGASDDEVLRCAEFRNCLHRVLAAAAVTHSCSRMASAIAARDGRVLFSTLTRRKVGSVVPGAVKPLSSSWLPLI